MRIGKAQILLPNSLDLHSAIDCQLDAMTEGERLAKESYRREDFPEALNQLERVLIARQRKAELEQFIPSTRHHHDES